MRFIFIITLLFSASSAFSQATQSVSDTTKKTDVHSPKKAMMLSAIVPGLGQAYNKKYWKMPIVYGAIGTTIYIFNYNNKLYKEYKRSYISKTYTLSGKIFDPHPEKSTSQVKEYEISYHKHRDLSVILTALFYTLNIVDAYVDAHLMTFDVSDNLSMNIMPSFNFYSSDLRSYGAKQKLSAGLTLSLSF